MKKPILTDGLFCVCGNCKTVGLISAAPSGNRHCRMAAPPYPAYKERAFSNHRKMKAEICYTSLRSKTGTATASGISLATAITCSSRINSSSLCPHP
ncbi:hypothetical protein EXB92_12030 [Salmonella enterica subsp. enterica serovar Typhimurium]|nr:hypothetical protein [Salmonella enterica subsp. enterica serovar Typhimurium]